MSIQRQLSALPNGSDSTLLGHYSVSFTLDTYAHVLTEHKQEGMALMDEQYGMQPGIAVEYMGDNIALGMQYIKDSISEHLLLIR